MRIFLPALVPLFIVATMGATNAQPPTVPYQSEPQQKWLASIDTEYQDCLSRIDTNPRRGRTFALRWITDGGGPPAIHCAAIGDLAISLPRTAANRLQGLAQTRRSTDPYLAARLYAQAAEAWSTAEEDTKALDALEDAYAMAPGALELHLIAAPIYAAAKRWGLTKRALDRAEQEVDLSPVALTLRGKAKKELASYESAATDVRRALALAPDNIDALVLRGELAQAGYIIDP